MSKSFPRNEEGFVILSKESLEAYVRYLETCNILRDREYDCPFCGKHYIYVGSHFNHLEKVHDACEIADNFIN